MTEEPLLKRAVELALTYEAAEKSTKDMQVRQSGQDSLVDKVSGSLSIIRNQGLELKSVPRGWIPKGGLDT